MTRADSVARFTDASCTPGTFFRAFSTRNTHEAQVIPPMPISAVITPAGLESCAIGLHMTTESA